MTTIMATPLLKPQRRQGLDEAFLEAEGTHSLSLSIYIYIHIV